MADKIEQPQSSQDLREKILSEFYTDEILKVLYERYPHADQRIISNVWRAFLAAVADIASVRDASTQKAGLDRLLRILYSSRLNLEEALGGLMGTFLKSQDKVASDEETEGDDY
jgi:hypothetical protein